MKANFDSTVSLELNTILRDEDASSKTAQSASSPEGSREHGNSSSPSHSHQIAFSSELPFTKQEQPEGML